MTRIGVLVLGMHRSGTSATAGVLARLGLSTPKTLMSADAGNPEGYWESTVLCEFHERLLNTLKTSWDFYTPLDSSWLDSDDARPLTTEGRELLRSEFGDARRFVLKDPRVCRLVPFWLRVFDEESVEAKAVLVVRPPFDVARSLAVRDGFPEELGLVMWLRYVLDAEKATRLIPRTWVRYHDLLDDWRSIARHMEDDLEEKWTAGSAAVEAEIDRFVTPGLRHHLGLEDSGRAPTVLADWLRSTTAAIDALSTPARAQAMAALDAVRSDFDQAALVFGRADEPRHRSALSSIAALEASGLNQARTLTELEARLNAELTACRERIAALDHELTVATNESHALRASMSWRVTAPLRSLYQMMRS